MQIIHVYTDGSHDSDSKVGGWACVTGGKAISGSLFKVDDAMHMELLAVCNAIEKYRFHASVLFVHTDCPDIIKYWYSPDIQQKLTHAKYGKYYRTLVQYATFVDFELRYVKGHNGHKLNEKAHRVAYAAMKEARKKKRTANQKVHIRYVDPLPEHRKCENYIVSNVQHRTYGQ